MATGPHGYASPVMPTDEPKQYVVGRVLEALAQDPRVGELDLQAKIAGRRVFLTGRVPTAERKEAVSVVAAETLPDYEICNEVTVSGFTGDEEVESLS